MDKEIIGLDAVQISAMRQCDDVCFFHRDGRSFIAAIKRKPAPSTANPFPTEQRMEIDCATSWSDCEKETGINWPVPAFHAFASKGNYDDDVWSTVAALLRKGDVLKLHWQRSAGSHESMRSVGFVCDVLDVIVERGDKRLRFRLDCQVCERHSRARMIRDVWPVAEYAIT